MPAFHPSSQPPSQRNGRDCREDRSEKLVRVHQRKAAYLRKRLEELPADSPPEARLELEAAIAYEERAVHDLTRRPR